jgi:hypothetical protein
MKHRFQTSRIILSSRELVEPRDNGLQTMTLAHGLPMSFPELWGKDWLFRCEIDRHVPELRLRIQGA